MVVGPKEYFELQKEVKRMKECTNAINDAIETLRHAKTPAAVEIVVGRLHQLTDDADPDVRLQVESQIYAARERVGSFDPDHNKVDMICQEELQNTNSKTTSLEQRDAGSGKGQDKIEKVTVPSLGSLPIESLTKLIQEAFQMGCTSCTSATTSPASTQTTLYSEPTKKTSTKKCEMEDIEPQVHCSRKYPATYVADPLREQPTVSTEKLAPDLNQVGGAHYKDVPTELQHWNYVIAHNLGYFEGQITKYVTRWRKKNGLEDLKKARHFLDKLIESESGR